MFSFSMLSPSASSDPRKSLLRPRQRRRRALSASIVLFTTLLGAPQPAHAMKWLAWLEELSGPGPYENNWIWTAEVACLGSRPELESIQRAYLNVLARRVTTNTVSPADSSPDVPAADAQSSAPGRAELEAFEKELTKLYRCRPNRSNNIMSVQLEYGSWEDKPRGRYLNEATLHNISAIAYFPLQRVVMPWRWDKDVPRWSRWVEVGVGVGAYGLTGSAIRDNDLWRGVIPWRVRVIPSEIFYNMREDRARDAFSPQRTRRILQAVQITGGYDWLLGRLDERQFDAPGLQVSEQRRERVRSVGLQIDLGMIAKGAFGR